MSRGFNRIILQGNITKDPEIRVSQQYGTKFANFTVAIGESWKDKKTGEKREHTEFVNCSASGIWADVAERYLSKGKPVLVEGKFKTTTYEKDGQRIYYSFCSVSGITLLGRKSGGENEGAKVEDRSKSNGYQSPADKFPQDDQGDFDFSQLDDDGSDVDVPF